MRLFLFVFALFLAIVLFFSAAAFLFLVDTAPLSITEYLGLKLKAAVFRYTGLVRLDEAEIKTVFTWTCTGNCHGLGPIETTRHTAREWSAIIERMRNENNAPVNERESQIIVAYLQKNYGSNVPTILSPEANTFLKQHLWKSDFGESDLYVDIIYAPREYFELMGGLMDLKKYDIDDHTVFMVYLNTHQNKLDPQPLDRMSLLRLNGKGSAPLDWTITYFSGDKHHMEGVLRFKKQDMKDGSMELDINDLPGQKTRTFVWQMPLPQLRLEGEKE
ncbi:MAG: hypothetical protein HY880_03910 [Deltaproteobacteria bacterium]|nr:hypothetical protein [Deltaproteobacteria bacterium]